MRRSRRCGCCLNFYLALDPFYFQVKGDKAWTFEPYSGSFSNRIYFDYVNKHLYGPVIGNPAGGVPSRILRFSKDLKEAVTIRTVDLPLKINTHIAINPWSRFIYYGVTDTTSSEGPGFLRRCHYDGQNDVELLTATVGDPDEIVIFQGIQISKEEEFVFYSRDIAKIGTDLAVDIRRCEKDGTEDTLIFDATGQFTFLVGLAVDNVNKRLFFGAENRYLYRCGFDGSGATQIFDPLANRPPLPAGNNSLLLGNWSHSRGRLFVFYGNFSSTTFDGLGLWSMKADGSDLKSEMVWPNFRNSTGELPVTNSVITAASQVKIGCGFEDTGPATLGS